MTVQILDDTLVVLSLGKLCEEHWDTYEWDSAHLQQLIMHGAFEINHQKLGIKTYRPELPPRGVDSSVACQRTVG